MPTREVIVNALMARSKNTKTSVTDSSLHVAYRAVVVAKLTYAASAWWGFASAADRQRIEAVLRRGKLVFWRCFDHS